MEGIFTLDDTVSASWISRIRAAIVNGAAKEKKLVMGRADDRDLHMHWIPLLRDPNDCDKAVLSTLIRWIVETKLVNITDTNIKANDLVLHVAMKADEIREDLQLPEEYQERFDTILQEINAAIYPETTPQILQTPRASNVSCTKGYKGFSDDNTDDDSTEEPESFKTPEKLSEHDAGWICLQLAEFFSSRYGNGKDTVCEETKDLVVASLAKKFEQEMTGLLPWFTILDYYDIPLTRKETNNGGFGVFLTAQKKIDAPSKYPEEIGIKVFRTDVDQPIRMICNEMLLMKEACINRLFPTVHALSFDPVLPFVVTGVIKGGSLKDFIADEHDEYKRILIIPGLLKSMSAALFFLYLKKIVHRDVKPENILFGKKGDGRTVVLIDFGLCKKSEEGTFETKAIGTEGYIAPEIFLRNEATYDAKSDVFSLGMTVLCTAVGTTDFNQRTTRGRRDEAGGFFSADSPWLPNKLRRLGVDEEMVNLVNGMVATDPTQRLSCREVYDHDALKNEPDILKELGLTPQQQTQDKAQEGGQEVQDEVVADLQEQLANQQARADNAEKDLAEAKREIENLQRQSAAMQERLDAASAPCETQFAEAGLAASSAASAPGETGLEQGFSELQLQAVDSSSSPFETDQASVQTLLGIVLKEWASPLDYKEALGVSTSKRGRQTGFADMFINELEGSGGAGVNFGACAAFVTAWNQEWEVYQGKTELERPNLVEFLSKFPSYRAGLTKALQVNAPIGKKFKDVKKAFPDGWLDGAKTSWLAEAKKVSSAIKRKLVEANIADTKTFSSALTKIECAVGEVFDGDEYRDSHGFGLVSAPARKTISTLLAVIHFSSDS